MPVLSPDQIAKLDQILRDGSLAVAIATAGYQVTPEELQRLVDLGYLERGEEAPNLVFDAFLFGVVMQQVAAAKGMTLAAFRGQLLRNPVPLSKPERAAVEVAQQRAGTFCVGLGSRYRDRKSVV